MSEIKSAIIIDGSYFFTALYNKFEAQWKKRSTLEKHQNSYYDGYEFINHYMENIPIFIRELIVSFKIQSNIPEDSNECRVYMTRGSKTSWRKNVMGDYQHGVDCRIQPLLDIIFKDNIGMDGIEIFQNFNLESDDCIAIILNKILDKHPDAFVHIVSKNKRLIQLETEKVNIVDINRKAFREISTILSESQIFTPNKYLFFLILKGDEEHGVARVFYEEKTDFEYERYYDNNDLIAEECEDIILAERLRTNYLICDYNSLPKKLVLNFVKNNASIV
jgi:hypothetical protein